MRARCGRLSATLTPPTVTLPARQCVRRAGDRGCASGSYADARLKQSRPKVSGLSSLSSLASSETTPETLRESGALQREDWPVVYCSSALLGELWLSEDEVLGGNLSFLLGAPNSDEDSARYD